MMELSGTYAALRKESERLAKASGGTISKMSVPEIVLAYHSAISISSILAMLQKAGGPASAAHINSARHLMSEFNSKTHPEIARHLDGAIGELRGRLEHNLRSARRASLPQLHDELRQMMSTREFVAQYDRGLG